MVCYACHEAVGGPLCVGCGALQPPPAQASPFQLLGIERRYHLDLLAVEARYRALARQVHPDRFASRPAVERRMALQWTAALNEARRVLRDDVLRARYLAIGQAQPREKGGPTMSPAFLAQIFEWRERDEEEPGVMSGLATQHKVELDAELDAIFSRWEAGSGDLSRVDELLAQRTYLDGLIAPSSTPTPAAMRAGATD
jgi:molecular chaperone HscB